MDAFSVATVSLCKKIIFPVHLQRVCDVRHIFAVASRRPATSFAYKFVIHTREFVVAISNQHAAAFNYSAYFDLIRFESIE